MPFESRISGREEYLPVVGAMVGAKGRTISSPEIFIYRSSPDKDHVGSDLMLLNLAKSGRQQFGQENWVLNLEMEAEMLLQLVKNINSTCDKFIGLSLANSKRLCVLSNIWLQSTKVSRGETFYSLLLFLELGTMQSIPLFQGIKSKLFE